MMSLLGRHPVVYVCTLITVLLTPVLAIPVDFNFPRPNLNLTGPTSLLSPEVIANLRPSLLPLLDLDFPFLDSSDSDVPEYFNISSSPFYTDVDDETGITLTLPATPLTALPDLNIFGSHAFIANMSRLWEYTLPLILAEYNATSGMDALIAEGIPILSEAVQAIFEGGWHR
jgi:hypothetical protein